MTDKTIIFVTGANTGLGYETVKQLLQSSRTYHILLGGRDIKKAEAAVESLKRESGVSSNSTLEPIQINVESDESITGAYEVVKKGWGKVDVLLNNAGEFLRSHALVPLLSWASVGDLTQCNGVCTFCKSGSKADLSGMKVPDSMPRLTPEQ